MSTAVAKTLPDDIPVEDTGRTPAESAAWVLPLLREYAKKLDGLADRLYTTKTEYRYEHDEWLSEAGRLICAGDAVRAPVAELASYASGLVERAPLDYETKLELSLRRKEVEEALRFTKLSADELVAILKETRTLDKVRALIERSGRYKSPV